MFSVTVNKNDAGQRVDKFLQKTLNDIPLSLLYKYLRTKKIKCNRKRISPGEVLCEGDIFDLYIPEEFYPSNKKKEDNFTILTPHIDVIFEDENLILVNKRPGMSCVPDEREETNTLINHIKAYLYRKGEYDPNNENSFAPALCNRIDRNTAGIVIGAKNSQTLRHINEEIREHRIEKKYLCVVHGIPPQKEALLKGWLIKDSKTNTVTVFNQRPERRDARTIITGYQVIRSDKKNNISLLEVKLHTGRTHQIRAHLASIGFPLYGDGKYGINKEDRKNGYKYQALCSYSVKIDGITYSIPPNEIWFVCDFFGKV